MISLFLHHCFPDAVEEITLIFSLSLLINFSGCQCQLRTFCTCLGTLLLYLAHLILMIDSSLERVQFQVVSTSIGAPVRSDHLISQIILIISAL